MKNILILVIVFTCLIALIYYFNRETTNRNDKILKNNIFIKGRVSDIKTSTNHAFGIILLSLDSANIKSFNDSLKAGIYPYKIENGKAELYTSIPDGISKGDIVIVNSNDQKEIYYYLKTKHRFKGSLQIVTDDLNVEFVKKNAIFK